MNIAISYNAVSNVGCVRSNNEDMALVLGTCVRDNSHRGRLKLDKGRFSAIVADGMGGYGGGEIASEIAIKSFDQFITNLPDGLDYIQVFKKVGEWFEGAQNLIISRQSEPGLANMGCTFTGIFSYEGQFFMLNAGDSRVYRLRGEILRQLTVDHSERERLKDPNVPSNLIYNALGVPGGFIDKFLLNDESPLQDGDLFIVCSDGLSDMIDDHTIEDIANQDGVDAAQPLVDAALQAGGRDNCTVVLFDYHLLPQEETAPADNQPTDDFQSATVPLYGMAVLTDSAIAQLNEIEQSEQNDSTEPLSLQEQAPQQHIAFNIDELPIPSHSDRPEPQHDEPQPPLCDPLLVIGAEGQTPTDPSALQTPTVGGCDPEDMQTPTVGGCDPEDMQTPTMGGDEPDQQDHERRSIISTFQEKISNLFGQSKKKS